MVQFGARRSGYGVYGQRYDATGAALGSEFQIHAEVSKDQFNANVAMNATGEFVVTWTSNTGAGTSSDFGVFGRLFRRFRKRCR